MPTHDPSDSRGRLRSLLEFARREGWTVSRVPAGCLRIHKSGLPPTFTGPAVRNGVTVTDRRPGPAGPAAGIREDHRG